MMCGAGKKENFCLTQTATSGAGLLVRGVGEVGSSPSVRYFLSRPPQKIFSDSYQRHHKIKPYSSPQLRKNFFGDPDLDKKFWACCLCSADGAGKGGKRAPVGSLIIARPNRSLSCRGCRSGACRRFGCCFIAYGA